MNRTYFCDCGNTRSKSEKACDECKKTKRPQEYKVGKKLILNLSLPKRTCDTCNKPCTRGASECRSCYMKRMNEL